MDPSSQPKEGTGVEDYIRQSTDASTSYSFPSELEPLLRYLLKSNIGTDSSDSILPLDSQQVAKSVNYLLVGMNSLLQSIATSTQLHHIQNSSLPVVLPPPRKTIL